MFKKLAALRERIGPGLRQVMANSAWLFTDKMLQLALGLFIGIAVARHLKAAEFGKLNYALTFVSLFTGITGLGGIDVLVIRDISRDPNCKNETLGTAFALQILGGLLTVFLTISIISLLKPDEQELIWLVAIIAGGSIFQAFNVVDYWFQSQLQAKYTVFAKNVGYFFNAFVRIGLIAIKAKVRAFAWVRSAEVVCSSCGLIFVYRKKGNSFQDWSFSLARAIVLLRESVPLILAGLANYIYAYIDQIMLGSLRTDLTEVGIYAVAVKISEIFGLFPMVIAPSVLPKLTALKEKSRQEYMERFQIYFDIMSWLWILVAIPITFLAPYIVLPWGHSFVDSANILTVYIWSQFGANYGVARHTYLVIEGKLPYGIYLNSIGAILNIVLNYFLIPTHGAMGATIATLITYFIVNIALNFAFPELRPVGMLILRSLNFFQSAIRIRGLVK